MMTYQEIRSRLDTLDVSDYDAIRTCLHDGLDTLEKDLKKYLHVYEDTLMSTCKDSRILCVKEMQKIDEKSEEIPSFEFFHISTCVQWFNSINDTNHKCFDMMRGLYKSFQAGFCAAVKKEKKGKRMIGGMTVKERVAEYLDNIQDDCKDVMKNREDFLNEVNEELHAIMQKSVIRFREMHELGLQVD